jgi:prolyl 4-hydroxylase
MHSSSSFPISVTTFIQYSFLAALAYVLAGAPLLSIFKPDSGSSYLSRGATARGGSVDVGKLYNLVIPEKNLQCKEHGYKGVYLLSREPLVVYIDGFLGNGEGDEVVKLR